MGGLFSKPKPAPKPIVPPPAPLPEVPEEAGEEAIKKARRRSGFQKTILTGSLTPESGKKTVLG
jgi:hypothetical protein